ncbi:conserved domain protein [Actinomyces sp. oral taxon 170 str. F0386]|nr:conserved domain protein [Actinomyces sp. oral taxon 170 str. F0386]
MDGHGRHRRPGALPGAGGEQRRGEVMGYRGRGFMKPSGS